MIYATRAAAKLAGATHYFTGAPCVRGHIDKRFTSIGKCMACAREDAMKHHVHTTNKRRVAVDTASFVTAAALAHSGRYSYEHTAFAGAKSPVTVTCSVHGDFQVRPDNHLNGKGCRLCSDEATSVRCNAGVSGFIAKAAAVHGDKYDYSRVVYADANSKVEIVCREHGPFWQTAYGHTVGMTGCTKCNHMKSAPEEAVSNLISIFTPVVNRDRQIIAPKELDIVIPARNLAIEYCGEYWHSHGDAADEAAKALNHYTKYKQCQAKGIRLITLFESEWQGHNYAIRRLLRNAIGASKGKVMARKCELREVDHVDARAFYDRYHPQGGSGSGTHYGLYWGDKLVACMRFTEGANDRGNNKYRVWTLTRYATRITVTGGASRLFSAFVKEYRPKEVKSFSDNRFFDGGMYERLGFVMQEDTKPDYAVWHVKTGVKPKSAWQRRNLQARAAEVGTPLDFDPETDPRTEQDITYLLGGRRIYDCGKKKWVWRVDTPKTWCYKSASPGLKSSPADRPGGRCTD